MVALKIFSLEDINEENPSILLEGEHVIGRGALNCNDKRVSRKHAIISICKDLVTIKAIHINPCFFKAAKGGGVVILTKDTSVVLNDGDQFAFLANLFWFKARISDPDVSTDVIQTPSTNKRNSIEENSMEISKRQKTSNDKIDNTNQVDIPVSDNVGSSKNLDIASTASDHMKTEGFITHENLTENIDSKKLINSLNTIVTEDYGNKADEDFVNNNDENITVKVKEEVKIKTEEEDNYRIKSEDNQAESNISDNNVPESNDKEPDVLNTDNNTDGNAVGSIKIEASTSDVGKSDVKKDDIQNEDENHSSVTDENDKQNKVQENQDNKDNSTSSNANTNGDKASCSTTKNDDSNKNTRRERCWYGPSCYRKNPIHRVDFSHPGDNDYDTDPDDDRPPCPFGVVCYRKNLQHRRQYKHSNPPAPKPNGDGFNKKKKRKNAPKKKVNGSDSEESDDSTDNKPKRKAAAKKNYTNQDSSEDDYDYNDPFIDNATSDEFELSNDDDDDSTDWEDSQKVDEESQETRRLLKEAKRFTKAKKNKD